MVVLCNLFSRNLSRREQTSCDSGYATSFSADNAVAQARCGHQDERRYRHSNPGYTFDPPIWGGRLRFNLFLPVGTARTEIDDCDRRVGTHRLRRSKQRQRQAHVIRRSGPPALPMKSNQGANNFMIYTRGGVPIGAYNADRIVNLGDGHASLDNGFGCTISSAATGLEFSAVTGFTYNFGSSWNRVGETRV